MIRFGKYPIEAGKITIEVLIEFDNWLIGLNWHKATHEIDSPSYFAIHLMCLHMCFWIT
jgi:hypothetical protein